MCSVRLSGYFHLMRDECSCTEVLVTNGCLWSLYIVSTTTIILTQSKQNWEKKFSNWRLPMLLNRFVYLLVVVCTHSTMLPLLAVASRLHSVLFSSLDQIVTINSALFFWYNSTTWCEGGYGAASSLQGYVVQMAHENYVKNTICYDYNYGYL